MLTVTVDTKAIEAALDSAPRQLRYAAQQGINKTAYDVQGGVKLAMPTVFDRPTPYTVNSLKVYLANQTNLTAEINFKGKPSDHYLRPEVFGGPRPQKMFEKLLGGGFYVPNSSKDSKVPFDRYGNVSGSQILRMLSKLGKARADQNETPAKRKMRVLKGVKSFYITKAGHVAESGRGSAPPNIWFFLRKQPTYKPLLHYNKISKQIIDLRLADNIRKGISMAFKRAGK